MHISRRKGSSRVEQTAMTDKWLKDQSQTFGTAKNNFAFREFAKVISTLFVEFDIHDTMEKINEQQRKSQVKTVLFRHRER